jgi:hypothetical protein
VQLALLSLQPFLEQLGVNMDTGVMEAAKGVSSVMGQEAAVIHVRAEDMARTGTPHVRACSAAQ